MLQWFLLLVAGVVGLIGVVLAGMAHDTGMAVHGIVFLLFAVVFGFSTILRMTGKGGGAD